MYSLKNPPSLVNIFNFSNNPIFIFRKIGNLPGNHILEREIFHIILNLHLNPTPRIALSVGQWVRKFRQHHICMSDWRPQGLPWPPVKSMCFGNRSHWCFNRWHRRTAPVKKHMKVDNVADIGANKKNIFFCLFLADMVLDMVFC